MKILHSLLLSFLISFMSLSAQENDTIQKTNTVQNQFDKLYKDSNNYRDYKVVDRTRLQNLKKNTLDSINSLKKVITGSTSIIEKQKGEIEELNQSVTIAKTELNQVNEEKEVITFLGISFTKDGFKKLIWTILIILLALLFAFIYKYQKSLKDTKIAIANLKDLENEFEDHRRRALEREQIVMRKLQDEINKKK